MRNTSFLYLISLLFSWFPMLAETDPKDSFLLKGRLLDANTMQPIANAHIYWSKAQAVSDQEGKFSIWVKEKTLLSISHIGYAKENYLINDKNESFITVFLNPAEMELDGVTVGVLPDEQTFKQQVLAATAPFQRQNQMLKSNLQFMKNIHHLAYFYDMNSYDKLLSTVDNKGFMVLFSNNPLLGIKGLIRRLKQKPVLPKKSRISNTHDFPLYPYQRKKGQFQKYFD
ncbi:carboxypeptidase-like regulatory domain-containing protein [Cyclobacterium sp. 1_MG-2023]|uniref:carboxypeptidase-like regulatory domain-containing protein n=1 Tax=Cyclobacterium sp. 1_MG-2023 TaxID=3062681 RepID=UPI0026E18C45|nr:carboxypeptidase-like regulatory domain-containing protein [Cyclobacterium sp. 1_MG-2023]MDO6436556.1 carboxypeptidase-like regulatory domain-containing protein [Cyclobacterium sp. 1_MG-2023]